MISPYVLVRSTRKTLCIRVLPNGTVEARVPQRLPRSDVDSFIREKAAWIREKQREIAEQNERLRRLLPAPGGSLPLFGREYPVAKGERVSFTGDRFLLPESDWPACRPALIELYRRRTLEWVGQRIDPFSALVGRTPTRVSAGTACGRWGSCSGDGRLRFSWMLAAAEPSAGEYVIVHELCHLRERNHSSAFWELVEKAMPDWKRRRALLRETERRLWPLRSAGAAPKKPE